MRFKLSFQVMLAMLVIALIPMTILSVALQYKTRAFYDKNMSNLYEQISAQYTEGLKNKYNKYNGMAYSITSLGSVRELLSKTTPYFQDIADSAESISDMLENTSGYYADSGEMTNLMVYAMNDIPPVYTSKIVTYRDSLSFDMLNEENIAKGYRVWQILGQKPKLSLIYPISSDPMRPRDIVAYLVVDLRSEKFFHIPYDDLGSAYDMELRVTVTDSEGNRIWANGAPNNGNMLYSQNDEATFRNFGWKVSIEVISSSQEFFQDYTFSIALITVVLAVGSMMFALLFSQRLSARMHIIMCKMDKVKRGDTTPQPPMPGKDELALIDSYFNDMVIKLNIFIDENFLQKIAYQKAQFDVLQNQINPHFLYNTLEIIDSMASSKGDFAIGDVCNRLGQIFRYNVNKDGQEFTTFHDELKHVQNYAEIQLLRFSSRFQISYEIDPNCLEVGMLKFILQPLVENAIIHALEAKGKNGLLSISAHLFQENLIIEVADNGSGFPAEKLEEYVAYIAAELDREHLDFSSGIGLKNVITRIKLIYGKYASIALQSTQGNGTLIRLVLAPISNPLKGFEGK